jgi:1,4-dihydroxy-2-naphthoyl-CoA hydrolase
MRKTIWKHKPGIEDLNALGKNNLGAHLGMKFVAIGPDRIWASMPVDERTKQPMGLLHGGANVALAETLGSVASQLCIPGSENKMAVGIEINANHLKSARSGRVYGMVQPLRIGKSLHVWQISIKNSRGQLLCTSRLTCMIINA